MIAAGVPVLELLPFSATGAGIAPTAFDLSLISQDGLLACSPYLRRRSPWGGLIRSWGTIARQCSLSLPKVLSSARLSFAVAPFKASSSVGA